MRSAPSPALEPTALGNPHKGRAGALYFTTLQQGGNVQRWTRGMLRDVWYCSASDLVDNLYPWSHWQVVVHRSVAQLAEGLRAAGLRAERLAGVEVEVEV